MAIGKSFIAITISLQEIFATNDFVPLIIRCFATIKFSEFCIIAPNHQNQGILLNVFLKLKKLKLKIITIVIEFLSSCFVELSSRPYKIVKDSLSLSPKSVLQILLCLTPDDFTRQRETPQAGVKKTISLNFGARHGENSQMKTRTGVFGGTR